MQLKVDKAKCLNCGTCANMSSGSIVMDGNFPKLAAGATKAGAQAGVGACPTEALTLVE